MDIHRLRIVPYPPSAINALAFTHSSGTTGNDQPLRLAIGRSNGDIEIWNPLKGAWHHETTFRGGKNRSVEGLAWIQQPNESDAKGFVTYGRLRLFSIGYSSTVTEWDLLTGLPLRQSSGNHSEVWCLAAQPRMTRKKGTKKGGTEAFDEDPRGQSLVAGCADGSLVLLSTEDNDLTFSRFLARASKKRARVLSLAFQNRNTIVAGFADSTIRVYDMQNGGLIRNMSLGSGPRGGPRDVLCWSVACSPNGMIISADSTGQVCFWDSKNYGQIQKIQGHRADALCLAVSEDGETVMSGGVDRRTVIYNLERGEDRKRRWTKTAHRRLHRHDVKAMASFENSKMSIVASGGLDTFPLLTPLRDFTTEYHRKLSNIPQNPPLTIAPKNRLIVSWWGNTLTIWKIFRRKIDDMNLSLLPSINENPRYQEIARLNLKGDHSISAACISKDGTILVVATSAEVKLFQLKYSFQFRNNLRIKKLEIPKSFKTPGARMVQVSDDSRWIVRVDLHNTIQVARLTSKEGEIHVLPSIAQLERRQARRKYQNSLNGSWGKYDRTVTKMAIGSAGNLIAVADIGGDVDSWVLEGQEDLSGPETTKLPRSSSTVSTSGSDSNYSDNEEEDQELTMFFGQHWAQTPLAHRIPRLASAPIFLSFRPTKALRSSVTQSNGGVSKRPTRKNPHPHSHDIPHDIEDRLLVLTASHELYEFEVLKGCLSDWSRRNPTSQAPEEFRLQRDRAMGYVWDLSPNRQRIWIYGVSWLCMFDMEHDFDGTLASPIKVQAKGQDTQVSHKRMRSSTDIGDQLRTKKYTSGAGSKIPDYELRGAIKNVRLLDREGEEVQMINLEHTIDHNESRVSGEDNEDDRESSSEEEHLNGSSLSRYRRNESQLHECKQNGLKNASRDREVGTVSADELLQLEYQDSEQPNKRPPTFYLTYRYRPILGIVPLLADPNENDPGDFDTNIEHNSSDMLEVAIIERPEWEIDLPPRYYGKQEWEKPDA